MTKRNSPEPTKSDRARLAILAAAQELFSQLGYDHTTIRAVAAKASIDPAMVMRYFGSKDELFARAASIDLNLPPLRTIAPDAVGETLARRFLEIWEGPGSAKAMAIMLRSATSNEFAAEKAREVFARQVGPAIASLGSAATAPQRAGLVSSQLLGLALSRYILRLPPIVAMSRDEIVAQIGPVLQRYATGSGFAGESP
jgi:AcrR family transcriptional regulator